jgi:hypothetical protein
VEDDGRDDEEAEKDDLNGQAAEDDCLSELLVVFCLGLGQESAAWNRGC